MAKTKIRAEVHVNNMDQNGDGITLELTNAQASDVLESVVAGDVLQINLVTTGMDSVSEDPAAYAQ